MDVALEIRVEFVAGVLLGEGVALGVDDTCVVGDGVVVNDADDDVIETLDDVEGVDVADDVAPGVGVAVAI